MTSPPARPRICRRRCCRRSIGSHGASTARCTCRLRAHRFPCASRWQRLHARGQRQPEPHTRRELCRVGARRGRRLSGAARAYHDPRMQLSGRMAGILIMDCGHGTRARRYLGIVLTLGAAVLLAGCTAGAQRRQEQALSSLQHALAGVYSSTAAAGGTPTADTAVTLTISPITAQLVGDAVFFVRETPADNEQLVLWQGIWTLA